jgi:hypothetical protein
MFIWEQGAGEIIDKATERYERHFSEGFPLYEYFEITRNKGYDFSVKGVRRLERLIDEHIAENTPVHTPKGYWERDY